MGAFKRKAMAVAAIATGLAAFSHFSPIEAAMKKQEPPCHPFHGHVDVVDVFGKWSDLEVALRMMGNGENRVDTYAHFMAGYLCHLRGEYQESLHHYGEAARLAPGSELIYNSMAAVWASLYYQLSDGDRKFTEEFLAEAKKSIESGVPADKDVSVQRTVRAINEIFSGVIADEEGRLEEAYDILSRFVEHGCHDRHFLRKVQSIEEKLKQKCAVKREDCQIKSTER